MFYNENDPYAARWLRNLIDSGHIPAGTVDARSINEVGAADLAGHQQVHLFAGIGGWPLALEMAGWPTTRPVWTGSCPCQPFSSAGRRRGTGDERHLWPQFLRLVAECRPATIFGEQVASRDGREWLAGVRADLEALGYAVGAADLCAASAGAPHIRQRLFWVAESSDERSSRARRDAQRESPQQQLGYASGEESAGGLGDAECHAAEQGRLTDQSTESARAAGARSHAQPRRPSMPWDDAVWLPCLDGKARRIEPGTFPLAHGVPARVGRLRAYGNAIVPQVAAEFVRAFLELARG